MPILTAATVTSKARGLAASREGRLAADLLAQLAPQLPDPSAAELGRFDRSPAMLVAGSPQGAAERHSVLCITPGTLSLAFVSGSSSGPGWDDVDRRGLVDAVADVTVAWELGGGEVIDQEDDDEGRGIVREWSGKSRARMMRTVASLDLGPLLASGLPLGMVTLTPPGDWLSVAPSSAAWQAAVVKFRKRFERYHGRPLLGIWKREFQARGAPHHHVLTDVPALTPVGVFQPRTPVPFAHEPEPDLARTPRVGVFGRDWLTVPFEDWLSWHWAESLDHPSPVQWASGVRAGTAVDFSKSPYMVSGVDLARYFLKHGVKTADGKEYQHWCPWVVGSSGRYWGLWGLEKSTAGARLTEVEGYRVKRVLRRWDRANAAHYGRRRRRSLGMAGRYGAWVLVDDPVRFVGQVLAAAGVGVTTTEDARTRAVARVSTARRTTTFVPARVDVLCDVCGGPVAQPGEAVPPWAPVGARERHALCGD